MTNPGDTTTENTATADHVAVVAALAEPTRRALYEFTAAEGGWVSRDRAADGVGLERGTAAHHLDRLVAAGLLEVDYQRLSDRTGPGAGRPAKLYRRAPDDFGVSLPPRDYELAGQLMARALEAARAEGGDVDAALESEALAEGERFAEEMRRRLSGSGGTGQEARLRVALEVLADHGYEPVQRDADTVVLRNCPFHRLSQQHTELVCTMNAHLLRSAVTSFGGLGLAAAFEPEEQLCCVKLRRDRS
ncbi:MAG: helix-turn-helix transcriptional regulator [Nocardioidaceae bacterium]